MPGSSAPDARAGGHPVGVIVLAAGESRRMGRTKQLLPFAGKSLLRRACETALATHAGPVVAVLGAASGECAAEIANLSVVPAYNPQWTEGMSGSLRVGLAALIALVPPVAGALILLADQPLVGPADAASLLGAWQPPRRSIAAAKYNGILGVPAVFARHYFEELMSLSGQEGARAVIGRHVSETAIVEVPAAARDLDSWEDYEQLLREEPEQ